MASTEGLYQFVKGRFDPNTHVDITDFPDNIKAFHLAMQSNGYFLDKNGVWQFDRMVTDRMAKDFEGQKVAFFGPNDKDSGYFSTIDIDHRKFIRGLAQPVVGEVLNKYYETDCDQAARIAFILGGIVRYLTTRKNPFQNPDPGIEEKIKYTAHLTKLAGNKSGTAVASSIAMYTLSEDKLASSPWFTSAVYNMAEAIDADRITPVKTEELGLSQAIRLQGFTDRVYGQSIYGYPSRYFRDLVYKLQDFAGFPTVGAEFHFPLNTPENPPQKDPTFWQKLALLNMSQYQEGSYIQFSRNDRGVIDVRMNPSVYPVTIANWRKMMAILPELKSAFFTATFNRNSQTGDFYWLENQPTSLLNKLRSIGMLTYASMFDNIPPPSKKEEITFGGIYLGQTVRKEGSTFKFTGNWSGGMGQYGQLGIYAGFGDNLPHLAYYLSMVLAGEVLWNIDPRFLNQIRTLPDAMAVSAGSRRDVFKKIQEHVEADRILDRAYQTGNEIIDQLTR